MGRKRGLVGALTKIGVPSEEGEALRRAVDEEAAGAGKIAAPVRALVQACEIVGHLVHGSWRRARRSLRFAM